MIKQLLEQPEWNDEILETSIDAMIEFAVSMGYGYEEARLEEHEETLRNLYNRLKQEFSSPVHVVYAPFIKILQIILEVYRPGTTIDIQNISLVEIVKLMEGKK